eukprot:m.126491 g.126491  ORF g.126491 m.126491 type:complete len:317 (-) comp9390_c0_seq10:850-1800(-)
MGSQLPGATGTCPARMTRCSALVAACSCPSIQSSCLRLRAPLNPRNLFPGPSRRPMGEFLSSFGLRRASRASADARRSPSTRPRTLMSYESYMITRRRGCADHAWYACPGTGDSSCISDTHAHTHAHTHDQQQQQDRLEHRDEHAHAIISPSRLTQAPDSQTCVMAVGVASREMSASGFPATAMTSASYPAARRPDLGARGPRVRGPLAVAQMMASIGAMPVMATRWRSSVPWRPHGSNDLRPLVRMSVPTAIGTPAAYVSRSALALASAVARPFSTMYGGRVPARSDGTSVSMTNRVGTWMAPRRFISWAASSSM